MIRTLTIWLVLFFTVIFAGAVSAQDEDDLNKSETETQKQQYDQNITIKKKPRVETARFCSQISGVVRLKVTFDKSEKVTNVEVVSPSGCKDFDKGAVRAAKKIKFKPALKNGEPVTVVKSVEYVFTLYVKDIK